MRSSFSATSPFAYQISPSSKNRRHEEISKTRTRHDDGDSSEQLMKKSSRSSDEGKSTSSGRSSSTHPSSASSIFTQQNITLESIPTSDSRSTSASPAISTSRPTSTSRQAKPKTTPFPHSSGRAAVQPAGFRQPKVESEDEDESSTPTQSSIKTIPVKSAENVKPYTLPSYPSVETAPAPQKGSDKTRPTSVAPKADHETKVAAPLPITNRSGSPPESRPRQKRSLDESQSRPTSTAPALSTASTAPTTAPTTALTASPPHSPRLPGYNPYNYPPGYAVAPPPLDSERSSPAPPFPQNMQHMNYGYMPLMASGPPHSVYGNPYYGMPFSPPAEPGMHNSEPPRSPNSGQDEHRQLLEKVAGVLPDINRLLNSYRETHGQLSAKEVLAKQADLSHSEQLNKLRVEIEANKKEYEKVIQDLVGERNKLEQQLTSMRQRSSDLEKVEAENKALRTEVEALQANKKELAEGLDSVRRSKEEMQTLKYSREKELESLRKALQAEKDAHHRDLADVKEQAKDQIEAKQKEVQRIITDHKLNYAKVQMELTSLLSKHNNQKKDLDDARSSEARQRTKFDLKSKEFEDALVKHRQDIDSIKRKHEDAQEKFAQEDEERVAKLVKEHSSKEREWERTLHKTRVELESEKTESRRLRDEFAALKNSREAEKLQMSNELVESLALWRSKSDELQKENRNLDRILQGLGYATEMKSKGDDFFLKAFRQLAEQIVHVSREFFVDLPLTPPKEKMLLIPPEIPNFMDTTVAAAKIRSCYIQHIISSILLARIFQPFLFTIGTQYGGVDTFLQCLSTDIRRKSERRESVWRQTTLRAAYTVSKAKETTNVVAGVIVDEIVDDIKHFAHPLHWPVITLCVQRIVKSAAEVWRFARIERELIKAFMTEVDTPDSDWPQPEFDSTTHIETNSERDAAKSGQLILCLLPHIEREPVHESFLPESNKPDNGPCIYLQGRALYSDSAAVLARQRELEVRVNTFKAPMDEMAQRITECQSVQ